MERRGGGETCVYRRRQWDPRTGLDHAKDRDVEDLIARIERQSGRLDLLVNNVWQWGPPEDYLAPTWEQTSARWDAMFGVAVRAHFIATRHALPLMMRARSGLVVFTQERPGNASHFGQNIVVDAAAVTVQRMARYLARELRPYGIAALLVYLGWVRSVNLGMGFDLSASGMSRRAFMERTQSPYFVGRAIATLAADPRIIRKSGRTMYAGAIAEEYGFTDVDGRVPLYEGGE